MITVTCDCCGESTGYSDARFYPPFLTIDEKLEWKVLYEQDLKIIREICQPCFKSFVMLYRDALKTILNGLTKPTVGGCQL